MAQEGEQLSVNADEEGSTYDLRVLKTHILLMSKMMATSKDNEDTVEAS